MRILLAVLFVLPIVACTDESGAQKALESQGFTHIQWTGYKFGACSEDDTYHTGFTAIGPTGKPASGTVCSAWLKGKTVRLD